MPNYPPKLPLSTIQAAPQKFWKPAPEFWEAIKPHVGDLGLDHRLELAAIIEHYVARATFEQNAATFSEAITRISELKATADGFWRALDTTSSGVGSDAMHYVEGLLNDIFERRDGTASPFRVAQLSMMMLGFIEACNQAERRISDEKNKRSGFKRGGAWKAHFIPPLGNFWTERLGRSIPRIRKDTDLHKVTSEVPFVAFARATEEALPIGFRRPRQGADAYRAAVSNALRGHKSKLRERTEVQTQGD